MKAAKNHNDTDEKREKMDQLHDAISRALAIVAGATAIGGYATISGRGVDLLRRLVLESESAIREAHDLSMELRRG